MCGYEPDYTILEIEVAARSRTMSKAAEIEDDNRRHDGASAIPYVPARPPEEPVAGHAFAVFGLEEQTEGGLGPVSRAAAQPSLRNPPGTPAAL